RRSRYIANRETQSSKRCSNSLASAAWKTSFGPIWRRVHDQGAGQEHGSVCASAALQCVETDAAAVQRGAAALCARTLAVSPIAIKAPRAFGPQGRPHAYRVEDARQEADAG